MTNGERNGLVLRLKDFDHNVDIQTFYEDDFECVSEAADQIEADGQRIWELTAINHGWSLQSEEQDERIAELECEADTLRDMREIANNLGYECVLTALEGLFFAKSRIAELEARLEIDPAHPYDGIYARDETIRLLDKRIAELEAALRELLHAVGHETGFAAAVRADSGCAYPWPPLDNALKNAFAALGDKA